MSSGREPLLTSTQLHGLLTALRDNLKKPLMVKCGHTFCHECVMRYIEVVQKDEQKKKGGGFVNAKCPVCKQVIKRREAKQYKKLEAIIEALQSLQSASDELKEQSLAVQPFAAEDPDACKQDEANGRNQFKEQKGGDEDTSLEQIKIEASSELSTLPVYQIGDEVTVLPRTWPGMNKLGGAGRVTKINKMEGKADGSVDVKYVLGGTEKRVPFAYVKKGLAMDTVSRSVSLASRSTQQSREEAQRGLPPRTTCQSRSRSPKKKRKPKPKVKLKLKPKLKEMRQAFTEINIDSHKNKSHAKIGEKQRRGKEASSSAAVSASKRLRCDPTSSKPGKLFVFTGVASKSVEACRSFLATIGGEIHAGDIPSLISFSASENESKENRKLAGKQLVIVTQPMESEEASKLMTGLRKLCRLHEVDAAKHPGEPRIIQNRTLKILYALSLGLPIISLEFFQQSKDHAEKLGSSMDQSPKSSSLEFESFLFQHVRQALEHRLEGHMPADYDHQLIAGGVPKMMSRRERNELLFVNHAFLFFGDHATPGRGIDWKHLSQLVALNGGETVTRNKMKHLFQTFSTSEQNRMYDCKTMLIFRNRTEFEKYRSQNPIKMEQLATLSSTGCCNMVDSQWILNSISSGELEPEKSYALDSDPMDSS